MFRRNRIGSLGELSLAVAAVSWPACALAAQEEEQPRPDGISFPEPAPDGHRPQRVDLGYSYNVSHPAYLDRENIADLAIAPMDLIHLGLQDNAEDPFYFRIPKWGAAAVVDMAILFAAHEYGHVSSISKSGYRSVVFGDKNTYATEQKGTNPWALFVEGLKGGAGTAVSVSNDDWQHIDALFSNRPDELRTFTIAMKGGGLNEEEVVLDRYAERLWYGNLSFMDTIPIVVSSVATLTYPVSVELSDIADYSSLLKQQGLDVSPSRIKALSAVTILSGSTLAALRGAALGLATRDRGEVIPFVFSPGDGVQVAAPDLENYLSEEGPTIKFSCRTRIPGVELQPSYERLFVGGKNLGEFGLVAKAPVLSLVEAEAAGFRNTDGGWWQELGVNLFVWKWLSLGLGYSWAWGYTFHRDLFGSTLEFLNPGERNLKLMFLLTSRF